MTPTRIIGMRELEDHDMSGPYVKDVKRAMFLAEDDAINQRPCICGGSHWPSVDCYMTLKIVSAEERTR